MCGLQHRDRGRQKVFLLPFSLRGAFAGALPQKEDACLPATGLRFFRILKRTGYSQKFFSI
jgi:hypothetical protein